MLRSVDNASSTDIRISRDSVHICFFRLSKGCVPHESLGSACQLATYRQQLSIPSFHHNQVEYILFSN